MAEVNAELAESAAAALVSAAGTEVWAAIRYGYAQLLAYGNDRRLGLFESRLNELDAEVGQVGMEDRGRIRQQLMPDWQVRFGDLLHEHPEAAHELQKLVSLTATQSPTRELWIQRITASSGGSAYGVQHGDQHVHHHYESRGQLRADSSLSEQDPNSGDQQL